ncbi:MAG: TetR/AcrR family transcriptional regulator [Myxococcota bacterium]
MSERRYDPEGTRRTILTAAREVFVDKGLDGASMSEIARAAGVTKSLIHHHFGAKDELWNAVKQESFEQYFSSMLDIVRSGGEGANPLRAAMEFTFRFHKENPGATRMLSWMHLEGDPMKHPHHDQLCREGLARIRQAQAEGHFRSDVDASTIQAGFLLLTTGYFQHQCFFENWDLGPNEPDGARPDRYLEQALKIFFDGVLPR